MCEGCIYYIFDTQNLCEFIYNKLCLGFFLTDCCSVPLNLSVIASIVETLLAHFTTPLEFKLLKISTTQLIQPISGYSAWFGMDY